MVIAITSASFAFREKGEESDSNTFPENLYLAKSDCVSITGEPITNVADYNGKEILIDPTRTTFCNFEFEVPSSSVITYDPNKSHAKNEDGSPCTNIQCALDELYKLYRSK